jgi:hypothetical protein
VNSITFSPQRQAPVFEYSQILAIANLHIFEIYSSLAQATGSGNLIHTSQLALPQATCEEAYATSGYSASVQNLSQVSLASDNVFSDGYSSQMATVSGDVTNGYTTQLTVGVDV